MQSVILMFFVGVFAANATPHFIKGITKDQFPTPFGSGPLVNLLAGWLMFVIASLLFHYAHPQQHYWVSFIATSLGVLGMGVFHATVGAFGKRPEK